MKIAVVGAGAVGIYYGAKLFRAGHDVRFLVRSDYAQAAERGFSVLSPEGNFQIRPPVARNAEEIGNSELVIVALKTTANHQFPQLVPPLLGPETLILTLQNGLGNEADLASLFGRNRILGGLCFVCLNRVAPGVVRHIAHGQIVMGEFERPPLPRTRELASTFGQAGIHCRLADNLERAHWDKLTWNIPFNGLGVASSAGYDAVVAGKTNPGPTVPCLTTDRLLSESRWAGLVRELMAEVIAIADALGLGLPPNVADEQIDRTLKMGAYKPSTVLDYEEGRQIELETLFLRPLASARAAGVPAPRLTALCAVLEELDAKRRG